MPRYSFEIGLTEEGMTNLENLAIPIIPPAWSYTEYPLEIQLPNGKVRGMGFPQATWHWDALKADEREALRVFCSGKSAEVYIKTPINEDDNGLSYSVFQGIMVWPAGENPTVQIYPDFTIQFRHLIEIEQESA